MLREVRQTGDIGRLHSRVASKPASQEANAHSHRAQTGGTWAQGLRHTLVEAEWTLG